MALAVHSTFTGIPQIGVTGQLAAELRNGTTDSNAPHNRSLTRLVQTALFEVEQHLHFLCFHTP